MALISRAYDHNLAFSLYNLALVAHGLNAWPYLHFLFLLKFPAGLPAAFVQKREPAQYLLMLI